MKGDTELRVGVTWINGHPLPVVSTVESEGLVDGADILGLSVDRAIALLYRQGWRVDRFDMKNFWAEPDRSTQIYTLRRPTQENAP
jgi:hypothetical protein